MSKVTPPVPERIGRYRIERLLGSGSMGFVYLGRDPELGRRVAIKTIRDLRLEGDEHVRFLQRFKNEARIAAQLQHPNIVQIHDVGEDSAVGPYLVFEYVPGQTLKALLRNGPLPPERIVRIVRDVASALAVAHRQEVVHRDIKPENLFVNVVGVVKLGDFGIARIPNAEVTAEGQFLGTPCYAAPETLRDQTYSAQSDLFSLAAVTYEMIAGKRAFEGADAVHVARKILHQEPVTPGKANPLVRVPPRVDAIVMRGLAKDAAERFENASAFADALHDAYDRAGLLPEGAGVLAETSAPKRSLLLFLSILLIGALFAFFAVRGPSPSPILLPDTDVTGATGSVSSSDATQGSKDDVSSDAPELTETVEATTPAVDTMTPHEREETAKDELERARSALEANDFSTARDALARAARYDPGNPDIAELMSELPPLSE